MKKISSHNCLRESVTTFHIISLLEPRSPSDRSSVPDNEVSSKPPTCTALRAQPSPHSSSFPSPFPLFWIWIPPHLLSYQEQPARYQLPHSGVTVARERTGLCLQMAPQAFLPLPSLPASFTKVITSQPVTQRLIGCADNSYITSILKRWETAREYRVSHPLLWLRGNASSRNNLSTLQSLSLRREV